MTARISALTTCCAGYVIGRPVITSCSLRKAMIEPANDSAPITADSTLVNDTSYVIGVPELTYLSSSPAATSAAAPPPAPLKIATICGIAVIFTRCADTIPTTAPTSSAAPTTIQLTIPCVSVATTAISMPTAP